MPLARGRSYPRRGLPSRRKTGWEEGPGANSIVTQTGSGVAIFTVGQSTTVDGITVVRIRGFVELLITAATSAGDGFHGALGIGIVSTPAFSVGVTAMPTPVTEVEWEGWMWHQYFSLTSPVATSDNNARQVFEIDSKAMRKVDSEETFFAAVESTEVGTSTLKTRLGTRMLFKLP